MQLRKFRGRDMGLVMKQVTDSLGSDAMIIRTSETEPFKGYGVLIEVVAASGDHVDALRRRLVVDAKRPVRRRGGGPRTIAFVGPPGAGKTTAVLKLVMDAARNLDVSVGVVTLDTYRAGALDEVHVYADVARVPLEVVYGEKDVSAAMKRLASLDVVLIDTPGWGGGRYDDGEWEATLRALDPDEVQLVLSGGMRMDVALGLKDRFGRFEPSHLLLTHLDEVDGDRGVPDLMLALDLPARWMGEGASLEASLIPAERRALGALGLPAPRPAFELEVV